MTTTSMNTAAMTAEPAMTISRTSRSLGVRSLAVLLAGVLLSAVAGLSLVAAPAGAATPTQLTNLRFSWSGGLLTKTQVRYVTVSLTLVDPDGIAPSSLTWSDGPLACPCVLVEHVVTVEPRSRHVRAVHLHLTSGTDTNGVWTGRFALGAADAGFWRPTAMAAGDIIGSIPAGTGKTVTATPAPWNQVTVNVRGYDWPRIWLGTPVTLGSQFVVRGGAALSRSGLPISGVMRIEIRNDCFLANQVSLVRLRVVRTNIEGRFFYYVSADQLRKSSWVCAAWVAYPTDTPDSFVVQSNLRPHG